MVNPVAILPVSGNPSFVSVGKSDVAAVVWLPPIPPVVLLVIVFVTVDQTP